MLIKDSIGNKDIENKTTLKSICGKESKQFHENKYNENYFKILDDFMQIEIDYYENNNYLIKNGDWDYYNQKLSKYINLDTKEIFVEKINDFKIKNNKILDKDKLLNEKFIEGELSQKINKNNNKLKVDDNKLINHYLNKFTVEPILYEFFDDDNMEIISDQNFKAFQNKVIDFLKKTYI